LVTHESTFVGKTKQETAMPNQGTHGGSSEQPGKAGGRKNDGKKEASSSRESGSSNKRSDSDNKAGGGDKRGGRDDNRKR
jgi:hypothetical protein